VHFALPYLKSLATVHITEKIRPISQLFLLIIDQVQLFAKDLKLRISLGGCRNVGVSDWCPEGSQVKTLVQQ
jgi:hypothetical protein